MKRFFQVVILFLSFISLKISKKDFKKDVRRGISEIESATKSDAGVDPFLKSIFEQQNKVDDDYFHSSVE